MLPRGIAAARGALFITLFFFTSALPSLINAASPPEVTETFVTRSDLNIATMRPAIAASDTGFLLCWTSSQLNTSAILGMRFDRNGMPVDDLPLRIADGAGSPRVCSDGKNFLVVWNNAPVVWTRVVHADGTLAEPIASVSTNAQYPYVAGEIAWGDGAYIIASFAARDVSHPRRPATAYEVVFWRVGANGRFLDGDPRLMGASTVITGSGGPPYNLRLAGSKRGALAVWQENYGLKGALARRSDYIVPIAISTAARGDATPVVASNNREFFVIWRSFDVPREGIVGVRLGLNGEQISGEQLLVARETAWPDWPAICPSRGGWLLAWMTIPHFPNTPNPYGTNATVHGIELRRDGRPRTDSFLIEEMARPFVLNASSADRRRQLVMTGRWTETDQIDFVVHSVE